MKCKYQMEQVSLGNLNFYLGFNVVVVFRLDIIRCFELNL